MKNKNWLVLLIAVLGIFCFGCASESTEESPASGTNTENANVTSENMMETNHEPRENYEQYSGNWTTEDPSAAFCTSSKMRFMQGTAISFGMKT